MQQTSSKRSTALNHSSSLTAPNGSNRKILPRLSPHAHPLRARNANGATAHYYLPSMIPVRVRIPAGVAPTTPSNAQSHSVNSLHPSQHQRHHQTTRQRPAAAFPTNAPHHVFAASLTEKQTVLQSVESAFNVYGERLQADLRDFRALCTSLVVKELEETRKWHSLSLKLMKERDAARQKIHNLEVSSSLRDHPSGTAASTEMVTSTTATSPSPPSSPRGSKRTREEVDTLQVATKHTSTSRSHGSPSTSPEPPILPLTNSPKPTAFPVHSPPGSPYTPTSPLLLPPLSSSSESDASIPPLSALSSSSSMEGVSASDGFAIPAFGPSATLTLPTFVPEGWSPSLSYSSSSSASSPSFSPPMGLATDIHPDAPPMKRRKSCGSDMAQAEMQAKPASVVEPDVKPVVHASSSPAGEPLHVDIMYTPMNGQLVCRACLLTATKQTKSPELTQLSAGLVTKCKSFPTSASWDDLRDHCVRVHPDACMDVARLHPAEVFELRRRLASRS
ncbi:hypothetical protein CVT26_005167 [Gymnopilus dilepis]|uniref:Uncharacterized protein n=1 Tax=Gymnopilus dilepis TaxID=231916 RepID=A0A409WHC7_9AGAR|nr:hypothetical protein CVT26_005167 [Gymnopilus dilepis]